LLEGQARVLPEGKLDPAFRRQVWKENLAAALRCEALDRDAQAYRLYAVLDETMRSVPDRLEKLHMLFLELAGEYAAGLRPAGQISDELKVKLCNLALNHSRSLEMQSIEACFDYGLKARAYLQMVNMLLGLDRPGEAEQMLERLKNEIPGSAGAEMRPFEGPSLYYQGLLAEKKGQAELALHCLTFAVHHLSEGEFPEHRSMKFDALNRKGALCYGSGDFSGAFEEWKRALAVIEHHRGDYSAEYLGTLRHLFQTGLRLGEYHQSRKFAERALSFIERTMPENAHEERLRTEYGLADCFMLQQLFDKARESNSRAMQAFIEITTGAEAEQLESGARRMDEIKLVAQSGHISWLQGRVDESQRTFERVLALCGEEPLGRYYSGIAFYFLGRIQEEHAGDWQAAFKKYEKAASCFEKFLGDLAGLRRVEKEWLGYSYGCEHLAAVCRHMADLVAAGRGPDSDLAVETELDFLDRSIAALDDMSVHDRAPLMEILQHAAGRAAALGREDKLRRYQIALDLRQSGIV